MVADFEASSQNCDKRLLAPSDMSFLLSIRMEQLDSTKQILIKFDI